MKPDQFAIKGDKDTFFAMMKIQINMIY